MPNPSTNENTFKRNRQVERTGGRLGGVFAFATRVSYPVSALSGVKPNGGDRTMKVNLPQRRIQMEYKSLIGAYIKWQEARCQGEF